MRSAIFLVFIALVAGCASPRGRADDCPDLTGAYLADGYGFEDSRRKKTYLGALPPLAGRQGEPGVVTVVRIEGPADGRPVFPAGDVSRGPSRAGRDGSLYTHSFERDSGLLLGLPISFGLDNGWARFRRYEGRLPDGQPPGGR